ncbi:hypothetical protein [Pseudomonas sp. RIT-PI-S]|uniref:hypothetical protein n=1 Tax=Pseudomonas sp. RIT-PI-S TaxID=3035295 RepID=UPI0021D8B2B3|nr:hypothetical protein [Pseudomonas sp. RIT-PI-S]
MRFTCFPISLIALSLLAGCATAPNEPTLTLETAKSPESYAACLMPKLQGNALRPELSQTQRNYRIVVPSSIAADNVIDAYKAARGGKVFVYERSLIGSGFSQAAKECA